MGRIVATVDVRNFAKTLDAMVDPGARHLTLPAAWKERFGGFPEERDVEMATATRGIVRGTVCGPARIRVEGFRVIHGEVLFADVAPPDGECEPLLGHIPLGQCGAAVDMIGHRLVPVGCMDLKDVGRGGRGLRA